MQRMPKRSELLRQNLRQLRTLIMAADYPDKESWPPFFMIMGVALASRAPASIDRVSAWAIISPLTSSTLSQDIDHVCIEGSGISIVSMTMPGSR